MSQTRFSRAFVIGAYIPNGGTYMAYHVGRILQYDFGIEAISVIMENESIETSVQNYDLRMPTIPVADLSQTITDDDILIVNPSFSNFLFGWRLNGLKVSYVQNFATYTILDCRFDRYVAVSEFVQRFLKSVYAINAPVIPAFINLNRIPRTIDWERRPQFGILPYKKGVPQIWEVSFERLKQLVKAQGCEVNFEEPLFAGRYLQDELFMTMGKYRYLLMLSVAEGFPLVPLEAMAMGTIFVGYDGFGGRQYMRSGENCAVAAYPEIEQIADLLVSVLRSPDKAILMSNRARETAKQYSYEIFRKAWIKELSRMLAVEGPSS